MKKTPVIVFPEPNRVIIEEREIPTPKRGEVLIRTNCSLISTGTELTILSGNFPPRSAWANYGVFPFLPGYCNVGTIVGVGEDVDEEWLGKRVASYAPHSAFVTSHLEGIRLIERVVPDEEVAFFTIAEICLNGIRRAKLKLGESVAIYGLGLLGQLTARFAWLAGARPVIGIDVAELRLEKMPNKPGIFTINPRTTQLKQRVEELTRGHMVDVVFEVTGNPELIPQEFAILRRQGRMVILSSPYGPTASFDFHDLCNSPSFTIIGAHNMSHPQYPTLDNPWTQKRHFQLFIELLAAGELDIENLITHRVPYWQAPQIYSSLLEDRTKALGIIIYWQ